MPMVEQYVLHGLPVRIVNTRSDIKDFAGIVVRRFACRGAFFPESSECLVELSHRRGMRGRRFSNQ